MKKLPILILVVVLLSSCKSEYEKIRTSNEPEKMLEAATKYYDEGDWAKAQYLYEAVIPYYRGNKEAEELYYRFAETHYNLKEYILASHYYENFAKTFFSSPRKQEADFMAAYAQYKISPNHRLDQGSSNQAIEAFQNFVNTYPESPKVEECNTLIDELRQKLEDKAYGQGELYYNLKRYDSAITSFGNMLKDFPETQNGEEIRFLMLKSSYYLAVNSIYEKKEERFEKCLKQHKIFDRKYPVSTYSAEIKSIYEDSLTELNKLKDVRLKNASSEH